MYSRNDVLQLTLSQYARGSDHSAPYLVVELKRKLRYVAIFRVLESLGVSRSKVNRHVAGTG